MGPELYTAAQGLVARQLQMDVVATNIANANTTGFRETTPFFQVFNKALETGPLNPLNGAANNQPVLAGSYAHSRVGGIKHTGNDLDLAIDGDGYFKVGTPDGPRYTRNGHFALNANGGLVTSDDRALLDTNGNPIILDPLADIDIAGDGAVFQNGNQVAQLAVVELQDKTALVPQGDLLMADLNPNSVETQATGKIKAGYLETSNVNIAEQMIEMIVAHRSYEANSRAVRSIDRELNQVAIQGLGPRR